MVLKRAKPNKKNRNADQYNFRVGTAQKKADFQSRTNRLKEEKNISAREIYEAGLKVFEEGDSEAQILYRRNKTISERDTLFNMFFEYAIRTGNRAVWTPNDEAIWRTYDKYSDMRNPTYYIIDFM